MGYVETHLQENWQKLVGVWQKWKEIGAFPDTHARNRAENCGCVAKMVGNRGDSGHTCKKSGKNSWVCGKSGRKLGQVE